jgi:two-component system response regulator
MTRPKRILLVEDNPDDVKLTRMALKKNNIANDIDLARNGVEAIEYLFGKKRNGDGEGNNLPAVVLLDLKMPKVDGLEVLKRIRSDERTKLLPVVVLTTSTEERDIIESYKLGCNSYVCKPVDFHNFADAVKQLGLYWLVINEPSHNNRG